MAQIVPINHRSACKRAAEVVAAGGVVVFPTETVYGLAVRAGSPAAAARLRRLKGRPDGKPFQLIVSGPKAAGAICEFPEDAKRLAKAFWPGPLTLVLRFGKRKWAGVRLPDHAVARRLAQLCGGAIVSTSANISGFPPAKTADEAARELGSRVAFILDGGPAAIGKPSTVVKCTGRDVVLLREGAISREQIEQVVGNVRKEKT